MSASPLAVSTAAPRRWLSIVGIGEDGIDGLSPVARGLIAAPSWCSAASAISRWPAR